MSGYPRGVLITRLGAARALVFGLGAWLLATAPAFSEVTTVPGGAGAPIVRVQGLDGNVTIRTWDRPDVQIEGDPSLYTLEQHVNRIPAVFPPTPISPGRIVAPDGTPINLPAESFVVSTLPPGPRDVVVVKGAFLGSLTVTVPSNTPVLGVQIGHGSLSVDGYRNGTLIAHMRNGNVSLHNMSGDAFVQDLRGTLAVSDSSFGRLRARGALGPMVFERDNVRQIEVTNVNGSIVYDRGTFEPGLARFASEHGDVAVGVASGPAELGGSVSDNGRVYTMFDGHAQVDTHDGHSYASLGGGGGATVNATSGSGNVYLYDGSLRARPRLPAEWQTPFGTLSGAPRSGFGAPGAFGGQSRTEYPARYQNVTPYQAPHPLYQSAPRPYEPPPRAPYQIAPQRAPYQNVPQRAPYQSAPRAYGAPPAHAGYGSPGQRHEGTPPHTVSHPQKH